MGEEDSSNRDVFIAAVRFDWFRMCESKQPDEWGSEGSRMVSESYKKAKS